MLVVRGGGDEWKAKVSQYGIEMLEMVWKEMVADLG